MPGLLGVGNVHELHEDLADTGWSIPAADIRTRDHDFLDWPVFLALLSHIPFQVLHEFLVEKVLWVAHVEQLDDAAGYFALWLVKEGELYIVVGDVFVGEQVGAEDVVGGTTNYLLQSGDVGGIGREAQTESLVAEIGRVAFELLIAQRHSVEAFHGLLSAGVFLVLQEAVALRYSAISHQVEEFEFTERLANLADLLIIEREWKPSEVDFVISAYGFQVVLLEVLVKEEVFGLNDLESVLLVVKLGMRAEEIFYPA